MDGVNQNKYIRTENDEIIIFAVTIQHDAFKHFNPKSAGYIATFPDEFYADCNGKSETLLIGHLEDDSELATKMLFGSND
jgi:hypothetical protein